MGERFIPSNAKGEERPSMRGPFHPHLCGTFEDPVFSNNYPTVKVKPLPDEEKKRLENIFVNGAALNVSEKNNVGE